MEIYKFFSYYFKKYAEYILIGIGVLYGLIIGLVNLFSNHIILESTSFFIIFEFIAIGGILYTFKGKKSYSKFEYILRLSFLSFFICFPFLKLLFNFIV